MGSEYHLTTACRETIYSIYLKRHVTLSVVRPKIFSAAVRYRLLLFNDGQDFEALQMERHINEFWSQTGDISFVVVGIHADHDRLNEYGTAARPDYAGRGAKAEATTCFVLDELMPFLKMSYRVDAESIIYAGFSLGGLMALDIAWNHSEIFSKVAVFSGALWWRTKSLEAGYRNSDRIMHAQIRESDQFPALKFWFQTGTEDETDDRDGDGVIDSIQDTLECISELEKKGYLWNRDIVYREVLGGRHDTNTWSQKLPDFLQWAFDIPYYN